MAMKLDGMSLRELESLIERAQSQLASARKIHVASTRAKVMALVEAEGLQLSDVFPRLAWPGAKRAGAPKYRNPDDPSQTWTGHGMRPGWFVAALKKRGVSEATLRIDSAAPASKARGTAKVVRNPRGAARTK